MQFAVVGLVVIQMCTESNRFSSNRFVRRTSTKTCSEIQDQTAPTHPGHQISAQVYLPKSEILVCFEEAIRSWISWLTRPSAHARANFYTEFLQCLQVNMFSPSHLFILCHHSPWCSLNMSVLVFTVNCFTNCMCDVQLGIHFVRNRDQL